MTCFDEAALGCDLLQNEMIIFISNMQYASGNQRLPAVWETCDIKPSYLIPYSIEGKTKILKTFRESHNLAKANCISFVRWSVVQHYLSYGVSCNTISAMECCTTLSLVRCNTIGEVGNSV